MSFSVLMFQLLLASLLLRVLWLDQPDGQTIFDENYYVNAARIVLHVPVESGQPYAGAPAGLDPNTEHPPLGKLLIAGSMWLFGDNPYGWRIPAVVFGTATIGLIAGCVLAAGGSSAAALTAAFLVAFDNLAFVHSRLGTLDVFVLAFSVLCIFCYLRRWPLAAGAALGLAGLVKIHGLWLALAIIGLEGYLIWRDGEPRQLAARSLAKTGAAALVAFGGGLLILDRFFTTYAWPWQHLQRIFGYGLNLKAGAHPGQFSYPWDWLLNQQQMPYYHLDRFISANGQVLRQIPEMSFTGAMNPYLIFLAPIAIASAAYIAWKTRDRLAALAVCWMIATYLPFYALAAAGRVSYIFYFLPTVPAVALAIGLLLQRLPLAVRCAYLAAYLLGFASLFPFRVLP
ncbi:MAG TPA: glycosyltransferase family 39 protein [Chloroflexota bacterium]